MLVSRFNAIIEGVQQQVLATMMCIREDALGRYWQRAAEKA